MTVPTIQMKGGILSSIELSLFVLQWVQKPRRASLAHTGPFFYLNFILFYFVLVISHWTVFLLSEDFAMKRRYLQMRCVEYCKLRLFSSIL